MDDGLVPIGETIHLTGEVEVLILVVVDDGLVQGELVGETVKNGSLNPCCSGRWSRTLITLLITLEIIVLILVVVDDGLVLDLIRHY